MSESLGQAVLELIVDSGKFDGGIDAAGARVKELGTNFAQVGGVLAGVGIAVSGAMLAMVKSTADYGSELEDARQRTGVSVEELAKLRFAAEQSGSSFEGLTTGLKFLGKNMDAATESGSAQAIAFNELGVSVTDANGKLRPTSDVLLDVADKFALMDDGAEKSNFSMKLFGKAGSDLIPVLNEGKNGILAMGEQAQNLGIVMSGEAAAAAEVLGDTTDQMTLSIKGAALGIGEALIPTVQSATEIITRVISSFGAWAKEHQGITKLIFGTAVALTGAGGLLLAIGGALLLLPTLAAGIGIVTTAAGVLAGVFTAMGPGAIAIALAAIVAITYKFADATGIIDALALKIGKLTGAYNVVTQANNGLKVATEKAASVLKEKYGVTIEQGNRSLYAWNTEVVNAIKEQGKFGMAVVDTTAKAKAHETQLRLNREAAAVAAEAHKKFREEVDTLKNSFIESPKEAKVFELALKELDSTGQINAATMLKMKEKIFDLTASKNPLIAKYQELIPLIELASTKYDAQKTLLGSLGSVYQDLGSVKIPLVNTQIADTPIPPSEVGTEYLMLGRALEGMNAMQKAGVLEDGVRFAQMKGKAEEAKKALIDATESVRNSAGQVFDAMLTKGESVFSSLGNLLKGGALSIGRSIFEDVAGALLGPIKAAFDTFFKDTIGGMISGMTSGLSKSLGKALSGIFGGGSSAAGSIIGGGASTAAGVAGEAGNIASGGTMALASGIGSFAGTFLAGLLKPSKDKQIEENTRFTYILITDLIEQIMWPIHDFVHFLADITGSNLANIIPTIEVYSGLTIDAVNSLKDTLTAFSMELIAEIRHGIFAVIDMHKLAIEENKVAFAGLSAMFVTQIAALSGPIMALANRPVNVNVVAPTVTVPAAVKAPLTLANTSALTSFDDGGISLSRGLAMVDAGELHIPAGKQQGVTISINVSAIDASGMDRVFRESIIPRIRTALKNNTGGLRSSVDDSIAISTGTRPFDRR